MNSANSNKLADSAKCDELIEVVNDEKLRNTDVNDTEKASDGFNQNNDENAKPSSSFDSLVQGLTTPLSLNRISEGQRFSSLADFEAQITNYEEKTFSNFCIGSSELLKDDNGQINQVFKYRYFVLQCIRFGAPRCRGKGLRPNQTYLPSHCGVTLRVNYSFELQCLHISVFKPKHNHVTNAQTFVTKRRPGNRFSCNSLTKSRQKKKPNAPTLTSNAPASLNIFDVQTVQLNNPLFPFSQPSQSLLAMLRLQQLNQQQQQLDTQLRQQLLQLATDLSAKPALTSLVSAVLSHANLSISEKVQDLIVIQMLANKLN